MKRLFAKNARIAACRLLLALAARIVPRADLPAATTTASTTTSADELPFMLQTMAQLDQAWAYIDDQGRFTGVTSDMPGCNDMQDIVEMSHWVWIGDMTLDLFREYHKFGVAAFPPPKNYEWPEYDDPEDDSEDDYQASYDNLLASIIQRELDKHPPHRSCNDDTSDVPF